MIVKYIINDELNIDRKSLCDEFNLSRTKLHKLISNIPPTHFYKGFYLYNYDMIMNHIKKNEKVIETYN